MSTKHIQTSSPGTMHSFSTSTMPDSRIPRSTTRASSMASSPGGPDSKVGWAMGMSSAPVVSTPMLGVSPKGVPGMIFTPAMTSVFPSFTLADPSADSMQLVSTLISLTSVIPRPSCLLPSASRFMMWSRLISDIISLLIRIPPGRVWSSAS